MGLLKKITFALQNQTTYQVGLLQTKAYRVLKHHTAEFLEPSGISTVEWALLGTLYDVEKGMRLNNLAEELGVEAPFVTRMLAKLTKKDLLKQVSDPEDSRAKLVCLTRKGREFVDETEKLLRTNMKEIFKHTAKKDLLSYLQVLQDIAGGGKDKTF